MLFIAPCKLYTLHSTGTQNYWREPPDVKIRVSDTSMLVSENAKICVTPNANFKICVNPNAKPQRESGEYIFFGVNFICVGSHFSVEYGLKAFCG